MTREEKLEALQEAFTDVAHENMKDAIQFSASMLVACLELSIEQAGEDSTLTIEIEGDKDKRKITVHALEESEQQP